MMVSLDLAFIFTSSLSFFHFDTRPFFCTGVELLKLQPALTSWPLHKAIICCLRVSLFGVFDVLVFVWLFVDWLSGHFLGTWRKKESYGMIEELEVLRILKIFWRSRFLFKFLIFYLKNGYFSKFLLPKKFYLKNVYFPTFFVFLQVFMSSVFTLSLTSLNHLQKLLIFTFSLTYSKSSPNCSNLYFSFNFSKNSQLLPFPWPFQNV